MKISLRYYLFLKFLVAIILLCSVELNAQQVDENVQFSQSGGFYNDSFQVHLGPIENGIEILYTMDGSEPKLENLNGNSYLYKNSYAQIGGSGSGELLSKIIQSYLYESAILIDDRSQESDKQTQIATSFHNIPQYFPDNPVLKGTVLRARFYDPTTNEYGPVTTHTYFVSTEHFWDWTLPVISLSISEDDLFDYEKGIYVGGKILDDYISDHPGEYINGHTDANYKEKGDEWERPANFEYFETVATSATLNHQIDVRIHGGFSRSYPVKSLRLYAKNKYGVGHFEHKFFNQLDYTQFKRLLLRNSGNDYNFVMFRDVLIRELVRDLNIESQAFQPTILFINGEYWGIHHLRERIDDHYLEQHYGVDRDKIDYLTLNNEVEEGSNTHYLSMMKFIRSSDMSSEAVYNQVNTMMDVDNFIDYLIVQIFIGNTDWPANNIKYWREQVSYNPTLPKGRDGRWRWILYDTDFGFGLFDQLPNNNSFFYAMQTTNPTHSNPLWSTELYRLLNTNPDFKDRFSKRFMDLLNTIFLPEYIKEKADSIQTLIRPHMPMHIDRWSSPTSMDTWQQHLDHLNYYILNRSNYIWLYLRSRYQLGSTYKLTINIPDVDEGSVTVNSLNLSSENEFWSGTYTTRKNVSITAIPTEDFDFSHWLEMPDSTNARISGIFDDNNTLTPVFKKITSIVDANASSIPTQTTLHQNYPNPFNPSTQIRFSLPQDGNVKLDVYDINGKLLFTQLDREYVAGTHQTTIRMDEYSSGAYIIMLRNTEGVVLTKLITLLK